MKYTPDMVVFGEVLWDLLPTGPKLGGAPMNVAYHLRKLGNMPAIISRIGIDERGKELLKVLAEKDVTTDFIQLDLDFPTGIVHAKPNEEGEMQYDIVAPVAWDAISLDPGVEKLMASAEYFVFGSLAARNKTSHDTLMSLLAGAKNKVLDINLRAPHFNKALVEDLLQKADIVKMNNAELELITGWFSKFTDIKDRMQLIQEQFYIPTIILTRGGNGAILNKEGKFYSHEGFIVRVADTVGSGDAFLAAILSKFYQQESPEQALEFACALGALVASKEGGCPDYSVAEIELLTLHT